MTSPINLYNKSGFELNIISKSVSQFSGILSAKAGLICVWVLES